jgi:hypothetical protein
MEPQKRRICDFRGSCRADYIVFLAIALTSLVAIAWGPDGGFRTKKPIEVISKIENPNFEWWGGILVLVIVSGSVIGVTFELIDVSYRRTVVGLPLDQQGREGFHDLVFSSSDSGVQPMGKTLFEKIREKERAEFQRERSDTEQRLQAESLQRFRKSALTVIGERYPNLPQRVTEKIETAEWNEITEILSHAMRGVGSDQLIP